MDSSSPIIMIGGQRSLNATPHQHHYYSTPEQPSSLLSTLYRPPPPGQDGASPSHHLGMQAPLRRSSLHHTSGGVGVGGGPALPYGSSNSKTSTPLHHLQNQGGHSRTPRSRNQSPSVNSLGAESSILMDTNLSGLQHHPHHLHNNINSIHHSHHDNNINININCDSSHSISPPNSNSNTTISCGSGNSTSANIGVPTNGSNGHHLRRHNNNSNGRSRNGKTNNNNNNASEKELYENYRNRNCVAPRKSGSGRGKKSILEEDCPPEKGDFKNSSSSNSKFSQRPPFINPNQEFLPICDALFNMISLAAYFCDCVFDILTVYSWYKLSTETDEDKLFELASVQQQQRNRLSGGTSGEQEEVSLIPKEGMWQWSLLGLIFIFLSFVLSQCLSFKWYRESERRGQRAPDGTDLKGPPAPCSRGILVLMHVGAMGVLWRYFKLFIPVDLRFVKNEVRDLCLLRLVHAFCEAAPMLLLQLYIIWHEPSFDKVSDLTKVSTALSLFSVCWALASFSKHIRRQNVHKLVLTWLGVIMQFFWRLGTVTSRFLALSLYALAYRYWVVVVLFLHWFCMLLWLISPKNIFHGEKMSPVRKVSYSAIVAVVYTFCYINVQETNSRVKVIIYYVTMFLENSLLLGVWLTAVRYEDEIWFRQGATYLVFGSFWTGLAFMGLYYRYFHVKKLSYVYDAESSIYRNTSSIGGCSLMNDNGSMVATINGADYDSASVQLQRAKTNGVIIAMGTRSNSFRMGSKKSSTQKKTFNKKMEQPEKKSADSSDGPKRNGTGLHVHQPNVPGVFNCRFHPAMKRKKKKPTTFVPPPAVRSTTQNGGPNENGGNTNTPQTQRDPPQQNPASPSLPQRQLFEDNLTAAILQSPHSQLLHSTPNSGACLPYPHNELHHQHHPSPLSLNHPHLLHHYEPQPQPPSAQGIPSHYDLPEYDPRQNSGSGSSSYGLYHHPHVNLLTSKSVSSSSTGRVAMMLLQQPPAPFWRRPLSLTMGSENEGSVSSRIDIQQKLQEKKHKQLAELREIEEEIKQGKLKRPEMHEIPQPQNQRQPIPIEKKQPWFSELSGTDQLNLSLNPHQPEEIILDPHQYLLYSSEGPATCGGPSAVGAFYYSPEWPPGSGNYYEPVYQNDEGDVVGVDDVGGDESPPSGVSGEGAKAIGRLHGRRRGHTQKGGYFNPSSRESIYKSYRIPSDIDSQMSLPRSYTLPREFKYKRKFRKPVKTENFLPSTNSSDGDVDSGEDPDAYSEVHPYPLPLPLPSMHHIQNESSGPSPSSLHQQQSSTSLSVSAAAAAAGGICGSLTPTTTTTTSPAAPQPTTRSSRKLPNAKRHKLHETKL